MKHIGDMLTKDRQDNGSHGAAAILKQLDSSVNDVCAANDDQGDNGSAEVAKCKVSILTRCNTGSLAIAGCGTALGVIQRLHELGQLKIAYCSALKLSHTTKLEVEGIPGTLIADSMVAAVMESGT